MPVLKGWHCHCQVLLVVRRVVVRPTYERVVCHVTLGVYTHPQSARHHGGSFYLLRVTILLFFVVVIWILRAEAAWKT